MCETDSRPFAVQKIGTEKIVFLSPPHQFLLSHVRLGLQPVHLPSRGGPPHRRLRRLRRRRRRRRRRRPLRPLLRRPRSLILVPGLLAPFLVPRLLLLV